jgi:molybdate transport repressor ModE-like protein
MIANLTLLQSFYHVASEKSYSSASRTIGISYQSLVNHIRRLEQVLKNDLINSAQGGRQIELTPYGRSLFKLLKPELDIMLSRLDSIIEEKTPILRLGTPSAAFFHLLPDIISRMLVIYPDIEIQTMERDTVLPALMVDGSIDVCINESLFGESIIQQRLLGHYDVSLIYPANWDIHITPETISEHLINKRLVTYEAGQSIRNITLDYLKRYKLDPTISTSTSSSTNIVRCVEEGIGFSMVPSWCANPDNDKVISVKLLEPPQMGLYFGNLEYLGDNQYVKDLYNVVHASLKDKVPAINLSNVDND